jgi:hypothetical protein
MILRIRRAWRLVALSVLIPGILGWFYTWALWSSYTSLPRVPAPDAGRVYPRGIHGITVYQTLKERNKLDFLLRASVMFSAVGFALAIIEEETWKRSHPK